jgi:hypothetical protein
MESETTGKKRQLCLKVPGPVSVLRTCRAALAGESGGAGPEGGRLCKPGLTLLLCPSASPGGEKARTLHRNMSGSSDSHGWVKPPWRINKQGGQRWGGPGHGGAELPLEAGGDDRQSPKELGVDIKCVLVRDSSSKQI